MMPREKGLDNGGLGGLPTGPLLRSPPGTTPERPGSKESKRVISKRNSMFGTWGDALYAAGLDSRTLLEDDRNT